MIATEVRDGQTWAKLQDLQPWELNPRDINPEALKQLVDDLKDAESMFGDGQLIPLVVTTQGVVVGGNQRLKAYTTLGWTDVWVKVIDAQNPAQIFKAAMRLNHIYGYTDEAEAARVASEVGLTEIEAGKLFISTGEVKSIDSVVKELGPTGTGGKEPREPMMVECPGCGAEFEAGKHKLGAE